MLKSQSRLKWLPNIHFLVKLPLLTAETYILYENFDSLTIEATRLRVRLWKWSLDFRLYWKYKG